MSDHFVATDADGLQHHDGYRRRWSLPVREANGWRPGDVVEADEHGAVVLLDAGELLDQLGECVFVAEPAVQAGSARLVAGTSWSEKQAASFALDCVEHILDIVPGSADAELPDGGTLGAIIVSAREYLETGTGSDVHRLGFVSRIAAARRLRRESTAIGDAAFTAAAQAEGQGVDIWSDPAWGTLAAARDAVLAAVEAVRHDSAPHLVQAENTRYEESEGEHEAVSTTFETPWGPFHAGLRRGAVPAWVAATEAAERARQSVGDALGSDGAAAERAWQRDRLLQALRGS